MIGKTGLVLTVAVGLISAFPAMAQNSGIAGNSPAIMNVDQNGDGIVSKEEYMAGQEANFARLDTNGDGGISSEDAEEKYQDGSALSDEDKQALQAVQTECSQKLRKFWHDRVSRPEPDPKRESGKE